MGALIMEKHIKIRITYGTQEFVENNKSTPAEL